MDMISGLRYAAQKKAAEEAEAKAKAEAEAKGETPAEPAKDDDATK